MSMTADQVAEFVGLPYAENGYGPAEFMCWGLLHFVRNRYYAHAMDAAPIGDGSACLELFKSKTGSGEWAQIEGPVDGCGVLLRGGATPHVGVFIECGNESGVLHALEDIGVVFTRVHELSSHGFGRAKFYRLTNEC